MKRIAAVPDVRDELGDLYRTQCVACEGQANVKYFHLVKQCDCPCCGKAVDLLPGLRLAEGVRHPREVYHCPVCDALQEICDVNPMSYWTVRQGVVSLDLEAFQRAAEQVISDNEVQYALATVFSDFLRYQNLLCRYDTYALKCQDVFAVHGFPVALLACENNLLGIPRIGSGSFVHFVAKYVKAKQYAKEPYEVIYDGNKKLIHAIADESIETQLVESEPEARPQAAWLSSAPTQKLLLRANSLDGVFTDPPYFNNVQYAELMDFCYVWLRKFMGAHAPFMPETTRTDDELTGNVTQFRGLQEFTAGLSEVFCQMASALKPGAPLVFTYHHNDPQAYVPLIVAILDAGLTCTGVLVTPGEMSASLHIAGTKSSILDSVFVCRDVPDGDDEVPMPAITQLVAADVESMRKVPYEPTAGDIALPYCRPRRRCGRPAPSTHLEPGPVLGASIRYRRDSHRAYSR